MLEEEKTLKERFGNENHFSVPEGYFERLTAEVMAKLPEQEAQVVPLSTVREKSFRPFYYAAACLLALILSATIYIIGEKMEQPTIASATHVEMDDSDQALDEYVDYTMVENAEIYACLFDE